MKVSFQSLFNRRYYVQLYCRSENRGVGQASSLHFADKRTANSVAQRVGKLVWLVTVQLWRYCITSFGRHSDFPSLDRSVDKFTATVLAVLMTPLCRHFHCPSCGQVRIDRQTFMLKVILSSSLRKVVYCVPSLTVSRHYTVQSTGFRVRQVAKEIYLGCPSPGMWHGVVWWKYSWHCEGTNCRCLRRRTSDFCTEDGSSEFLRGHL